MTPWLSPRRPGWPLRALPVAYVTPCGSALWLRGRYQTAPRPAGARGDADAAACGDAGDAD